MEEQPKTRKRFVGRARKTAIDSKEDAAIEDSAVGFSSKSNEIGRSRKQDTYLALLETRRARAGRLANQVPDEILNDPLLNKAIEQVS